MGPATATRAIAACLIAGLTAGLTVAISPAALAARARPMPGRIRGALARAHLPGDLFGSTAAISVGTAVVGAPGENSNSGAAYVYARSHGRWHLQTRIADPERTGANYFGSAVAVHGATAAIGADGLHNFAGAVYVYVRAGTTWRRQATLLPPSGPPQLFGQAVALSGGTLVVGAQGARTNAGAVYVYARSGTTWRRQATLTDPRGKPLDDFGSVLALSGTTLVVGASGANSPAMAYVYARSGTAWHLRARLADPAPRNNDFFGSAVAAGDGVVLVGAWGSARAYVYAPSGSSWHRKGSLPNPGDGADEFGSAVAVSKTSRGIRVLVGAPNAGPHGGCGTAYDFTRSGGGWREKARIVDPRCSEGDGFGNAVAISGLTTIIGASGTRNNAGAAYVLAVP